MVSTIRVRQQGLDHGCDAESHQAAFAADDLKNGAMVVSFF